MSRRLGLIGIGSAIAALLSGCSGAQVLDHLVAHDTYHGPTGVRYGPDPRHLLDVYQPEGGTVPGNAPVVLFFTAATGQAASGPSTVSWAKPWRPTASSLWWPTTG